LIFLQLTLTGIWPTYKQGICASAILESRVVILHVFSIH